MKGVTSFGFHGAIGINFTVTERIHWFAEVTYNFQNLAPKTNTLTKITTNGVDKLFSVSNYDKETDYVDSYSANSSFQFGQSNTADQQAGKTFLPFSSVGLTIWLHFALGKKE